MRKLLLILFLMICASPPASAAIGNVTQGPFSYAPLNVQDTSLCSSTSPSGSYLIQQFPLNTATAVISLNGTFSGTITVYLTANSGTTWTSAGTVSSTTPLSVVVAGYTHLCADVTTYTSGIIGTTISSSLGISATGGGGSGVSSFTGDGNLLNNSASVGAVTASLANTGVGYGVWGNTGASGAAPSYNALSSYPLAALPAGVTTTISSGTATLNTNPISANTCDTPVTVAATGVLTTDNIMADFNGNPTGSLGYQPGAMLTIVKYPTSGNVNFLVCNNTANSITPAAQTINWRVVR